MHVDREQLRILSELPIGARHLQDEADRIAHSGIKPTGELKETIKRAAKIWLPEGKKPPRPRSTCNAPDAQQTDLEDAVEAAGGKRGGK